MAQKFCIQCGKERGDADQFCFYCGKRFPDRLEQPEKAMPDNADRRPIQTQQPMRADAGPVRAYPPLTAQGGSGRSSTYAGADSPLRYVTLLFIGLLVEVAAQIPHFITARAGQSSTNTWMWISGVATIIFLVASWNLARVNHHFAKAKAYTIANLVMIIAYGLVAAIMLASVAGSMYADWNSVMRTTYAVTFLSMIFLVVAMILNLLRMRSMLSGFAEVARRNHRLDIARKFDTAYTHYAISILIIVAFTVIAVLITIAALSTGNGARAIVVLGILTMIAYIYSAVAVVLIAIAIYSVMVSYHSWEVGQYSARRNELSGEVGDDLQGILKLADR